MPFAIRSTLPCLVCLMIFAWAGAAAAVPVSASHTDDPAHCDTLSVPTQVDELGTGAFPPDELITAADTFNPIAACIPGGTLEVEVVMTNLTGRTFDQVWYVADPETSILNFDGFVNGTLAFRIDSLISDPFGVNHALKAEFGGIVNDIFEPGETWHFVIDGYMNALGLPPSALASVGLVGSFSGGDVLSSGSIIAVELVPEPGTTSLLWTGLVGLLATAAWRKQKATSRERL